MSIAEPVSRWVESVLGGSFVLESLEGDASTNLFCRVRSGDSSSVLMVCAEKERLPSHVHMGRLFESLGLPVAHTWAWSESLGALLLEDLGELHLAYSDRSVWPAQYARAVECVVRLQAGVGSERATMQTPVGPYRPPVLGRNRLLWELQYFAVHYLAGVCGLSESEVAHITRRFDDLLDRLDLNQLAFCHRDCHSRNIMVRGSSIFFIDLQDARWGHPLYDLASLLCDSYVELEGAVVRACLQQFFEATRERWRSRSEFDTQYALIAAQRTLKAIGTFAAQVRLRGRQIYVPFIPRAARLAAEQLAQAELLELSEALRSAGIPPSP